MKKTTKSKCLLIIMAISMSSCATIFTGTKDYVTFNSNVESVDKVEIDGRIHPNVTFPYRTKVKKGYSETIVKIVKEGYNPSTTYVSKTFNGIAAINLLNILAWGIDAATGAMMKPEHKDYYIELEPIKVH